MSGQTAHPAGPSDRGSDWAALYDRHRPSPPAVLAGILTHFAHTTRPRLVVDLGSGTGLSTRYWADRAERVLGLEPAADSRRHAIQVTTAANVSYRDACAQATGLPAHCAQIVTCAQSLHWMDPQPTFAEAARILQADGVFAAYDYYWPPITAQWRLDQAFARCVAQEAKLARRHLRNHPPPTWSKAEHLARMQASHCFRFTAQFVIHQEEQGHAERYVGLFLSRSTVVALSQAGLREADLGVDELRLVAQQTLGDAWQPWYWSYHVRLGLV
jgi:SAM-dependent methyltransferase